MAPIDPDLAKNELRRDIDRLRHSVGRDCAALRESLDVPGQLRAAIGKHRGAWLAGAGILGFLLSRRPRRAKAPRHHASTPGAVTAKGGFWLAAAAAAKWIFTLLRPALTELLKKKLVDLSRQPR